MMTSDTTPAAPLDQAGWALIRHGRVTFAYTPTGQFAGAVGPIPAGPNTGTWWAVTTGLIPTVLTGLADQDAALASLAGLSGKGRS